MKDRIFIDSNIWVYLFAEESSEKRATSKLFIMENAANAIFVISWQVINEVINILKRKNKFTESDLRFVMSSMAKICIIQDFSEEILHNASLLREKHSFSFWDSLIIATAATAKCDVVISEDMQNDRIIFGMQIKNIYKS
ncbi:MAG: PIN domain-containing protein [Dysgonamonadaceae bacterium]|jgi:predicted nucleic acid-binding protein|nr:PIN domain-containing protein [Dysgonamonadaceae bacterium]